MADERSRETTAPSQPPITGSTPSGYHRPAALNEDTLRSPQRRSSLQTPAMPPMLATRPSVDPFFPQMPPLIPQSHAYSQIPVDISGRVHQSSLSSGSSSYAESFRTGPPAMASIPTSPVYAPQSSLAAHKRAFRQRRKDPSCDACRERKVKCDATDTMSCSECTSRGVKCQFTKETNRRMSSLKQVQDLEKQLNAARHQNRQLKAMLRPGDAMDIDLTLSTTPPFLTTQEPTVLETGSHPGSRPSRLFHYDTCRHNIRESSKGIFEPPARYRSPVKPRRVERGDGFQRPPQDFCRQLRSAYEHSFHLLAPVVDLDLFDQDLTAFLSAEPHGSLTRLGTAEIFAVLAIGSLQSAQEGNVWSTAALMDQSTRYLRLAEDENSICYCRVAFLLAYLCAQCNRRLLSTQWHAIAMSCAIDLGMHQSIAFWGGPPAKDQSANALWLAIYLFDRLGALEAGKPFLIEDVDCDVALDASAASLTSSPYSVEDVRRPMELLIPLLRLSTAIRQDLRVGAITLERQINLKEHVDRIARSLPDPLSPDSPSYLDLGYLWVVATVANMQIILYRHNLSPTADHQQRYIALDFCTKAALSTSRAITRSMQPAPMQRTPYTDVYRSSISWDDRARLCTSSMLCLHLWRCILVLSLALDFEAALACQRLCAAIGRLRIVNISCGRYLIMFLTELRERFRSGQIQYRENVQMDSELLAYASGDLQSNENSAWIWEGGDESDVATVPQHQPGTVSQEIPEELVWDRVRYLLNELWEEQRRQPQAVSSAPSSSSRIRSPHSPGSSERMSIASILERPEPSARRQ